MHHARVTGHWTEDFFYRFQLQPEMKLKNLVQNFRPTESKVSTLGERDIIPPNRSTYELQLSYSFNVPKAVEITPNLPWLSNVLYESEFESQLWQLFNSHKQLVACGDAYPSKWSTKVVEERLIVRKIMSQFLFYSGGKGGLRAQGAREVREQGRPRQVDGHAAPHQLQAHLKLQRRHVLIICSSKTRLKRLKCFVTRE